MNEIDRSALNLNLLPSLALLLETRNVTHAAHRAGVSQSAMSHALAALRAQFSDELLVPSGRRLLLTPRAEALASELPALLAQMRRVLEGEASFDPATAARSFRIATFDYFDLTMLPALLERTRSSAPRVSFELERFSLSSIEALEEGRIDLALVSATQKPARAGLSVRSMGSDPFVVIARRGRFSSRARLTLDQYVEAGHVLVSLESKSLGVVDRALEEKGRARWIALRVQHFVAAALAVASSDLVCTLPSSVAARASSMLDLQTFAPPISLVTPTMIALWPRSRERDAAHRWLRSLVFALRR